MSSTNSEASSTGYETVYESFNLDEDGRKTVASLKQVGGVAIKGAYGLITWLSGYTQTILLIIIAIYIYRTFFN